MQGTTVSAPFIIRSRTVIPIWDDELARAELELVTHPDVTPPEYDMKLYLHRGKPTNQ
jgi:hypothetical protein